MYNMFIHPYKTGGITVWRNIIGEKLTVENAYRSAGLCGEWHHFRLTHPQQQNYNKFYESDGKCVVTIRDPIEQLISAYNYQRYNMVVLEKIGFSGLTTYGMLTERIATDSINSLRQNLTDLYPDFNPKENQIDELAKRGILDFYPKRYQYPELLANLFENVDINDIVVLEQEKLFEDMEFKLGIELQENENIINYSTAVEIVTELSDECEEMLRDYLNIHYEWYNQFKYGDLYEAS